VDLLLEDTAAVVRAARLDSLGIERIEGRRFARYRTPALAAGGALAIVFSDRPLTAEAPVPFVVGLAALALGIGFVVALRRKPRQAPRVGTSAPGRTDARRNPPRRPPGRRRLRPAPVHRPAPPPHRVALAVVHRDPLRRGRGRPARRPDRVVRLPARGTCRAERGRRHAPERRGRGRPAAGPRRAVP